jgi:mannose-1-phosphate guanylyltransferase
VKAIVLSAGLGTRLGTLTADRPKALVEVGGRPLVAHVLTWLAAEGVDEVLVNLHYRPDGIRRAVGDGRPFGVSVTYVEEPELLGTAGTVRENRGWFGDGDVLVVYGDVLTDQMLHPLVERHRAVGADATVLVHRRRGSNSVLRVDDDGRVRSFTERPDSPVDPEADSWVFSGVQILSAPAVDRIPADGRADLPRDLYAPRCGGDLRLFALPLTGRRVAVDSPERLAEAEALFGDERSGLS